MLEARAFVYSLRLFRLEQPFIVYKNSNILKVNRLASHTYIKDNPEGGHVRKNG